MTAQPIANGQYAHGYTAPNASVPHAIAATIPTSRAVSIGDRWASFTWMLTTFHPSQARAA